MRAPLAALCLWLVAPAVARAQSICEVEPEECLVPTVIGTQPCTITTRRAIERAANGILGADGPAIPPLRVGCSGATVDNWGRVPCQILKAMAWAMTGWRQFCTDDACEENGRTVLGRGCRFGMLQVPETEAGPDVDLTRVAAELPYNAGTAARRLATEWGRTPCVGDQIPDVAEHWYLAVWAADAFTYANSPNNPAYPVLRPVYGAPAGSFDRGSYPFQEVVFGLAANPPREGDEPIWQPSPLSLPASEQVCGTSGCSPGDIDAPTQVHDRACPPATPPSDGGVPDASVPDGGDAGPSPDGGNAEVPTTITGCGCSAAGGSALRPWVILVGLLFTGARLRSATSSPARPRRSSPRTPRCS